MSTYALMRFLESTPRRYDRGIEILTLGRVDRAYDALTGLITAGQRVLDVGCGTGALTLRAARRGAVVRGVDPNPEMLAIAEKKLAAGGLSDRVELAEMGVAELDAEPADGYDVAMSGLCFSELSPDELAFTLSQLVRLLKPGGLLLVADEVVPRRWFARLAHGVARLPVAVVAFLLTQQGTHPLRGMAERLGAAGLVVIDERRSALGSFGSFVARKPPSVESPKP